MRLLKKLYTHFSPSGQEQIIRDYVRAYIKSNIPGCKVWRDKKGNLYIRKGYSDSYPCVVAHMDQVQNVHHSKDFTVLEAGGVLFGYSPSNRRMENLGADDKNGIWIAIKCLEQFPVMKCAFFVEEEVGCRGSENCDNQFFNDCRFVVQPDRRGAHDIITSISWTELCSQEFLQKIQPKQFGYKATDGMMTDVLELKDNGLDVSCINLSCGYYAPHSDEEFTVIADLENCLAFVKHIIETITEPSIHIHEDGFSCYSRFDQYDEMSDIIDNELQYNPDLDAEETYMFYHDMFPSLTRSDIEEIIECYKTMNAEED